MPMMKYELEEIVNKVRYKAIKLLYRKNLRLEENYWKTNEKSISKDGNEYYVIRRKGEVGLFSIYLTTVAQIKYAIENGMIPVIDLMNYSNVYMGIQDIGKYNPWEIMFFQPSNEILSDIEKNAKKINYCTLDVPEIRPNDDTDFLYSLNNRENIWRVLVRNYMKVKPEILTDVQAEYRRISCDGKDRMLGVLCRGTDYIKLRPKDHPIQPSPDELFEIIDNAIRKYNCKKIFLATEDKSFEQVFKNRYKNFLFTIEEQKIPYKGGYLSDTIRIQTRDERMQTGINYLKKILLLSMCQCFVAGRTSGTVGVMLQDHNFEYTYFFDKGRYQ